MTISLNRLKSAIWRWRFLAGNIMETAFENQECIKVSLPCVYNFSLVLKTESRSLSKATNVSNLNPSTPPKDLDWQKPPKRDHISSMPHWTQKDLKIYNLATANATLMIHQNYVPPTPWHKMFNLAEGWGVTYQGVRGCNWKTSQNEPKNQFFGLILTIS